jgi:hypothetical protein
MRKIVAIVALGAMLIGLLPLPAHAHGAAGAALALGVFAVFNILFLPFAIASAVIPPAPVVYTQPAPVYAAAPAVYAPTAAPAVYPPAPAIARQVVYPHGRYVLYGDGVTKAYQWVWIPNPPPPGSAPGY